jgi:transposase-like protein
MRQVREILRLTFSGDVAGREIAGRLGIAPSTVRAVVERFRSSGLRAGRWATTSDPSSTASAGGSSWTTRAARIATFSVQLYKLDFVEPNPFGEPCVA